MGLVEYIHPSLETLDYKSLKTRSIMVLISVMSFITLFVVSHFVGSFIRTYNNLRMKEKVFWNLAVVRGIFGCAGSVIGVWGVFFDDVLIEDVVYATCPTSNFAVHIILGFFIFEVTILGISEMIYKSFNLLLNVHHWFSLLGFAVVVYFECGHFFAVKGVLLEMSTPFSGICWTLLKCNLQDSFIWKANQFILVHSFHLRSVLECHLWYLSYCHMDYIWKVMPLKLFVPLYAQLLLGTVIMTPYWTYKKTSQMIIPVDWNFDDSNNNKSKNGSAVKKRN
ncbi:unnamed protein product [Owenia fusiformis]|uniref:Uncharacterized protein n=1 Tax=Owenia fusiformis TaxID=6347 RepID=A0A8J1T7T5_OWEFU|nr:unnamed protein product [Owenia fusiformis]